MKTVDEIYGEMMAAFAGETGLAPAGGGDLSARFYAVAAQIYALYVQADWVRRQCFPQSAQEGHLDQHAQLRGLERRPAARAEGVLRFFADTASEADREIPAGTVCMTAGLIRFETQGAAVLRAGQTSADVRARAAEPGEAGNVGPGTVLNMAVAPVGVSRVTNPAAFAGGADREGDEALRARVLETFRRLPNGANAAFYHQGAMSFEEVAAAAVLPRNRGVGTVDVVVATPAGLPPAELLERLAAYFRERREIAVDVGVLAPVVQRVDVAVQVAVREGRDGNAVRARVEEALRGWFDGKLLGQKLLRAQLGALIFQVDGVENYAITAPNDDVAVGAGELPVLGSLTVEGMA